MTSSLLFVSLLLVGLVSAQNPASQVILGADGHGQLIPTPLDQIILGADGHGTLNPSLPHATSADTELVSSTSTNIEGTSGDGGGELLGETGDESVPALLGADGHGVYNPGMAEAAPATSEASASAVVTSTSATPAVKVEVVQFESDQEKEVGNGGLTETQRTPDAVTGTQQAPDVATANRFNGSGSGSTSSSGSGSMPPAVIGHDSFWTFTHYNNDSVCWRGFANGDDDDDDDETYTAGDEKAWCVSGSTWHLFAFASHAMFWSIAIMVMVMACTIHKRGRQNRELRTRMALMEINGMEYGDFVQATSLNDDRIELVPPSYKDTGSSQFPEKPRLGGGGRWFASVA